MVKSSLILLPVCQNDVSGSKLKTVFQCFVVIPFSYFGLTCVVRETLLSHTCYSSRNLRRFECKILQFRKSNFDK